MYRILGDLVGTDEARELAQQLVDWHDAMVKHLRQVRLQGAVCEDECPHDEAQALWRTAVSVFGDDADKLVFLQSHAGSEEQTRPTQLTARADSVTTGGAQRQGPPEGGHYDGRAG